VPGRGPSLSLGWRDDLHPIDRGPRVQDFASAARRVTGRQASGGQRVGTARQPSGHAPRTWAWAAAATLGLRHHPQGQKRLSRVEHTPDPGKALSLLAPTRGRAVADRLKRQPACARDRGRRS